MVSVNALPTASAVILAGGKSSRMGQPKALLLFEGEPVILHTVRQLQKQFPDIVVVAAPEQELPTLPVTVVRDEVAYQGPVGGILYGLRAAQHDICFVTSCDAPFLSLSLITYLLSLIVEYDVVVPYWQERLQPLHAVYRKSVTPLLEAQLARNELRPIFLYKNVRTREVSAEEIRRLDPQGLSFRNMNSPEDYQEALTLWQQHRQHPEAKAEDNNREPRPSTDDMGDKQKRGTSAALSTFCLTVELFGVARLKAKTATVSLTLATNAHLGDALHALAQAVPTLVGPVLTPSCSTLVPGYVCNVNGLDFTRDLSRPLQPGDQVLILSSDAGG